MEPHRHLRPLPSTTAGLRSTFDRLPYGCLLFMYRLDLTRLIAPSDETRSSSELSGKLLEIEHRAEGRAATPSSAMPSGKLPKQV